MCTDSQPCMESAAKGTRKGKKEKESTGSSQQTTNVSMAAATERLFPVPLIPHSLSQQQEELY